MGWTALGNAARPAVPEFRSKRRSVRLKGKRLKMICQSQVNSRCSNVAIEATERGRPNRQKPQRISKLPRSAPNAPNGGCISGVEQAEFLTKAAKTCQLRSRRLHDHSHHTDHRVSQRLCTWLIAQENPPRQQPAARSLLLSPSGDAVYR